MNKKTAAHGLSAIPQDRKKLTFSVSRQTFPPVRTLPERRENGHRKDNRPLTAFQPTPDCIANSAYQQAD